jgi:hypothetical protein
MQQHGIRARGKRRFRVTTTDSRHGLPIAPNLLNRNFSVAAPNRAWTGDITYIPTREGWLFLAVVIDLFSRPVVGWSMQPEMHNNLVIDALKMAWFGRSPDRNAGHIFHSDRGSQYASHEFCGLLLNLHGQCFETIRQAKDETLAWLLWYNQTRMHSTLGYLERAEPVLLVGDPGTGKSHLATGLAIAACRQRKRVRFTTAAAPVNQLVEAQREQSRMLARWSRVELIVIDELGYVPLAEVAAELLFQVIAERAEKAAIIVPTNLPFSEWPQVFTNARLCKAVLDRLKAVSDELLSLLDVEIR